MNELRSINSVLEIFSSLTFNDKKLQHMKCQNCWVPLHLHALGFVECVPHVEHQHASSEHLNVVLSTNTVSRAPHEAGLGSLEKEKKPLLTAKNVSCRFRVYNV